MSDLPVDPDQNDRATENQILSTAKTMSKTLQVEMGSSAPPPVYDLPVDPDQNDRATEIRILSTAKPHMRAFHCAWVSFFTAFFLWFSASALLPEIEKSLGLNHEQIWLSTICSDISTILFRLVVGPICDLYGSRIPMGIVLGLAAIPTGLTGVVNSLGGLCTVRFFIGIAGSAFVMSQAWTSQMFSRDLIGSANSIVAGWGNSGAAAAQIIMGTLLFPAFKNGVYDGDTEKAWRTIYVFPAVMAVIVGFIIVRISNDAPRGNYKEMKKSGTMDTTALNDAFRTNTASRNSWLLSIQYACCFGVEITTNNALPLYFADVFGQSTESAAALSSIFGFMNLFARPAGGILSDRLNSKIGMRGRLLIPPISLVLQGACTIGFAYADKLGTACIALAVFSIFVQFTEGAIFGIVPYVNLPITGYIVGIVALGGNIGGVLFSVGFRQMSYKNAFILMGCAAVASSVLSIFVHIPGQRGLIWDKGSIETINARHQSESQAIVESNMAGQQSSITSGHSSSLRPINESDERSQPTSDEDESEA